jgi:hypothetical protein
MPAAAPIYTTNRTTAVDAARLSAACLTPPPPVFSACTTLRTVTNR